MTKKILSKREVEAIRCIRNFIMQKGEFPSIRELMGKMGYKSPHSISIIIENLLSKTILRRMENGRLMLVENQVADKRWANTVDIPLVGKVACGGPILAKENFEAIIPVSTKLARPPYKYFLLKAQGDSMNKANIEDGDTVLVRCQVTADDGDIIVALIDGEATIKQYYRQGDIIILKPRSSNTKHKPIVLYKDFQIQGIVVTSISHLDVNRD